jgi:hypothetical protein
MTLTGKVRKWATINLIVALVALIWMIVFQLGRMTPTDIACWGSDGACVMHWELRNDEVCGPLRTEGEDE